jgi:hypothetical protein
MMTSKTALILATTAAIALGGFEMRPAAAAPEGGRAIVKQNAGADDFSAQRKRRRGRGVNPAVPLAAMGALIGTIGAVAAARRERDYYYERPYYGPGYGYYAGPPAYEYAQPQPYVRHHYAPPPVAHHYRQAPQYRGLNPDPFQRGPLQGEPGHMPANPPQAAPNDGRM